jgi:hypothetical protein
MTSAPATGLVLALAAAALVACGHSNERRAPLAESALAPAPTWGGCHEFSDGFLDYAPDARGPATARLAMAAYRHDGDHVVVAPRHSHTNRQWLLVDDRNVIHAALELWHAGHGWLVSRVERCED